MNYIKHDQYDQMYFSYLEQKYDLTRLIQGNQMKMLDKDMLFDLYNILFKEHVEVLRPKKQEVSRNEYIKFLLLNRILESNYLKIIKRYTVLNEHNSYLFISQLFDSFSTFSMWEDEDTGESEELLGSADQLVKETKKNPPAQLGSNKGRSSSHAGTGNNSQQNIVKQYSDLTDKVSKYINTNITFLQNLNQLSSLPTPDKVKSINMVYDLNRVADRLEKLKKELVMSDSGVSARLEKDLQKLSFYHGNSINKIIINEIDKLMRQISLQVEKDIHKKQQLYENLKKLSSHGYWDLTLDSLVRSNPEFCFYLAGIIKRHPEILKITKLIGNLKKIRIHKQKKLINSTYECKMNILTSSDITNLIPLELLYLEEQLENIFYNKLMEQKLYTYGYKSHSSKGKGGIIICLDTSGSMIGDKLDLLKAIILNIALGVLRQKRYFALINFSSSMKDILLLPHRPDFKEFIDLLTSSFYGGTNFDAPIKRTLEIIENFKNHRESDILIFTDGFGNLSDEVLNKLKRSQKKYHFGLFGFLIDDTSEDRTLADCCDRIFYLTSSNLLKDILNHLGKLA
jgi:uncharacterized protein with von Willebrand factor type A (vWA) domain